MDEELLVADVCRVRLAGQRVSVEDLGSRNGIRRDGQRVSSVEWRPGERLSFGAVEVLLEVIADSDVEVALTLTPSNGQSATAGRSDTQHSTFGSDPVELFASQYMPALLRRLTADPGPTEMAQAAGQAVFSSLPCAWLEITSEPGGVLFRAERETNASGQGAVEHRAGSVVLRAGLPSSRLVEHYAPVFDAVTQLLVLAQRQPPHLPAQPEPQPVKRCLHPGPQVCGRRLTPTSRPSWRTVKGSTSSRLS